jgi:kynurenine formamidase
MSERRLVDLSHPIVSGSPGYPGLPSPRVEPFISHAASRPSYNGQAEFEISRLFLVGNTGTYLDSPFHRFAGMADIADVPLERLAGLPGRKLRARFEGDGRRVVLDAEIGADLAGVAVLIQTGWDARWGSESYWQPGPYLDRVLAERLARAEVALVGVDFWNVDDTADLERPAHTVLLGAGIPIVEHLSGLAGVPGSGFRFSAVPPPVRGAASMPVRAWADLESGGF